MPVKRWIPRPSGIETPTSELQRSCSSPPPTSTAPTSVSSQRSRASPFVSVSTARNSAEASGWEWRFSAASSIGTDVRVIRLRPDGMNVRSHAPPPVYAPPAMRARLLPAGLLLALAAGCGNEATHVNDDRPAPAINVTASIVDGQLNVSPTEFGAGPVRFLVTNQTPEAIDADVRDRGQRGGHHPLAGRSRPTPSRRSRSTRKRATTSCPPTDGQIEPVAITVGAPRPSGQDRLLEP